MVPILHALPADWTADASSNYVINEGHNIAAQHHDPYRVVVLEKGYFYLKDLQVFDHLHRELKKGTDYQCLAISKKVANKTGLPACAVIVITNPAIGDRVFVNARMVGGEYCSVNEAIVQMAMQLLAGGIRKVYWKNVIDKPDDFRPNGHLHLLWQLYGFTKPTAVLKRMSVAVNLGTKVAFDGIYSKYRSEMDQVELGLTAIEERLTTHINDKNDPHTVTSLQIQLELVYNAPPASQLQAEQTSGSIMNYYATPLRAKESTAVNFTNQLMQHINNKNNPHGVTAATLKTYNVQQIQTKANLYYDRGQTVNSSYRIGNILWNQAKVNMRSNIPVANITSGFFPWYVFSPTPPNPNEVLMATRSNVTSWLPASYVIFEWEKKANRIYYVSGLVPTNPAANLNEASAQLAAMAGTWQPNGSMLVFRWYSDSNLGTGNGSIITRSENVGMAVMSGGRWIFPGY